MSLFKVPGWDVPGAPVAQAGSKKRKRPHPSKDADDEDNEERMESARKNFEKLLRHLGAGTGDLDDDNTALKKKKKREGKEKEKSGEKARGGKEVAEEKTHGGKKGKGVEKGKRSDREPGTDTKDGARGREAGKKGGKEEKKGRNEGASGQRSKSRDQKPAAEQQVTPDATPVKEKKQKKKQQRADPAEADQTNEEATSAAVPTASQKTKGKGREQDSGSSMTALQTKMKKSLDGARFRWINETLYKSDSAAAHELMSKDPAVFADYHVGFRSQVESWPTNPVAHYIAALAAYPPKTVVADLGCGDAALARALVPQGLSVLSFDLVADGAFVVEADTCARVPLPGSEPAAADGADGGEGEGQVVDVVVCALSLMGTNWPGCIREAWRILRAQGELKIAEVTSRFTDVEEFVSFVSAFGFKLTSKDERNTHFTLFEFKKVARKAKSEKDWQKLMARGSILKPCEYKRR